MLVRVKLTKKGAQMKKQILLMIALTIVNLLIVGCGALEAEADGGYKLVNLFGYECITNNKSIWCR